MPDDFKLQPLLKLSIFSQPLVTSYYLFIVTLNAFKPQVKPELHHYHSTKNSEVPKKINDVPLNPRDPTALTISESVRHVSRLRPAK